MVYVRVLCFMLFSCWLVMVSAGERPVKRSRTATSQLRLAPVLCDFAKLKTSQLGVAVHYNYDVQCMAADRRATERSHCTLTALRLHRIHT